MNRTTTTRTQFNHATTHSGRITPRLTWTEREILSLLQAVGREWTPDTKLARITLKFGALIDRLRGRGVRIQTLTQVSGAKFYRITPRPWLAPPSSAARPAKPTFILIPMSQRQKPERSSYGQPRPRES